jgi:phosphoribosylformylglycinamidine (FGAM) synthase-like amidotransferase family enzyme
LRWYGDDGSINGDIKVLSAIQQVTVTDTVSAGVVPAKVTWQTMNAGGTLAQRMQLSSAGGFSVGSTTDPGATNALIQGAITVAGLPTSAGAGGLNVCVDTSGVFYKKATCP